MSRFKGQRVAVLGLGIMGSRACSCLAAKPYLPTA